MTEYVLFSNSADINANQNVATRTGHGPGYKAAMEIFANRKIPNHVYVILRRQKKHSYEAVTFTNLFGEIPGLGGTPWVFE